MVNPWLGKKQNYILDVFMDGCDWPLTAMAESALPAAMHAALTWYCPDPVEIFTGWVRPGSPIKGVRSGSHARGSDSHRKGSKFWRRFKKVYGFDPNDWIAKRMPFAQDMEGRSVPGGARYGWAAFGGIQRFQNWMFMHNIVEDFFYEMQAGIASTDYCQAARASVFFARSERQAHFGPAGTTACVINEVLKQRKVSFVGGNGCTPQTPKYMAMFSVGKITKWNGDPDVSGCKLKMVFSNQPDIEQDLVGDGTDQACFGYNPNGGHVGFEFTGPYSFWADDCLFSVVGHENIPSIRPEGWCNKLAQDAINWANQS